MNSYSLQVSSTCQRSQIRNRAEFNFASLQGSCPSSQLLHEKRTSTFKERDGGHEGDFERTSGKPVRLRGWPNLSSEDTFLREAFIPEKKAYTSKTLTVWNGHLVLPVHWFALLVPLSCLSRQWNSSSKEVSAEQGAKKTVLSLPPTTCMRPFFSTLVLRCSLPNLVSA